MYSVKHDSAIKTCLHGNKSFSDVLEHEKVKKYTEELEDMAVDETKAASKKATKVI